MAGMKIKRTKIMRVYNVNVVRGRLYENYLTRKFSSRNIFNTYSAPPIHDLSICIKEPACVAYRDLDVYVHVYMPQEDKRCVYR